MQDESSRINVKTRRNKVITETFIDDLVVGDIVILSSGDKIPADGILVRGKLSVDESSLNGETKDVFKESISNINLANDINRVYRGTTIYDGEAQMVVTKVGMDTMYGRMAKTLTDVNDASPLKVRLTKLAKIISRIGYVAAILIALAYLFSKIFVTNDFDVNLIRENVSFHVFCTYLLEAMTLAVSVLVMSVPEGLPMMISLVLATNSKKMLKDNVLVRKMVGIETAGALNILFTDKTGTITKGKMEVVSVLDGDMNEMYSSSSLSEQYKSFLYDAILYNNESFYDDETKKIIGGNITDKALLSFVERKRDDNVKIVDKILFNSKNKYSVSVIEKDNKKIKLIKGAPDIILKYCSSYINCDGKKRDLDKSKILDYVDKKTALGFRAIAISMSCSIYPTDSLRRNVLIGILFIKDDIRKEAYEGVTLINNAGVNIIMVTGDGIGTATSIARDVGIIKEKTDIVITSSELDKMNDEEIKRILPRLKVVARALPEDKKRLVCLAKEMGFVTGMTGDGVNDTIALKKADVSFAMGSGTEVAKGASDIVILDDNILSISKAILYGRTVFKNIRKFIIFQLTVNVVAVLLALICPFIGFPTPITVLQMLWINMVMDTLAGLAFSYEIPRVKYMDESPKKRDEGIINKYMVSEVIYAGIYSLILCLLYLKLPNIRNIFEDYEHFMTGFFTLFILLAVFNSFNARTHRLNILADLKENKMFILVIVFIFVIQGFLICFESSVFGTVALKWNEILFVLMFSITIIPVDFVRKLLFKGFYCGLSV